MVTYPEWSGNEPCRTMPPELYFPPLGGCIPALLLNMCQVCTSYYDCLEWALHHELEGIWAGTTAHQRRAMRRSRGMTVATPDHTAWLPRQRNMKEAS